MVNTGSLKKTLKSLGKFCQVTQNFFIEIIERLETHVRVKKKKGKQIKEKN